MLSNGLLANLSERSHRSVRARRFFSYCNGLGYDASAAPVNTRQPCSTDTQNGVQIQGTRARLGSVGRNLQLGFCGACTQLQNDNEWLKSFSVVNFCFFVLTRFVVVVWCAWLYYKSVMETIKSGAITVVFADLLTDRFLRLSCHFPGRGIFPGALTAT